MTETPSSPASEEPRRNFMTKALAVVVGSIVGLVPIIAGAITAIDPLLRRRNSIQGTDDDGFLKVTPASSLDASGAPRLFPVIADLQDAWNKFPQTEIGSVYVWKNDDGTVKAFTARCPHLGCTVNYKPNQQRFACPCHDSSFNLDGSRNNDIPPRGMDPLEAEIRGGDVWIKFEKFRAGVHDRIPV
ncbi:MAG: Rieske (2Fe-2S) protein [Planctomycetaceae bacterium]|nr:Rieske (2Fe-2S) protein [Planctomycetaceae bacterium]